MPRPLRLEFQDAWYHVMNRGAGYQDIYKSVKHREIFLDLLQEASRIFGIEVHAYCLMDNHYHLLVKTPRANLSRAMRHINGIYTQRYNRLEKKDGPLFRGRYKAIIVDGDAYLLQASRYIHLNPVVAKMTKRPEQYRWSSYRNYLQADRKPSWLQTNEILSMLSIKKDVTVYQQFIEAGLDGETNDFYKRSNMPVIFGSKQSKARLLEKIEKNKVKASSTDFKRSRDLPSVDKINQICAAYFNLQKADIYKSGYGQKNEPRKIAMYGCRVWASEKLSVIAGYYGCGSHSSISNAVREIKKRIKLDKKFALKIEKIHGAVVGKKCQINT